MTPNRIASAFLLFLASTVHLPAQQSEAEHKLFEELKAKAEKGDAQSQFRLADSFVFGNLGLAKDEAEAVKWFRRAADQGHVSAQFDLGLMYATGRGVAKDDSEAVKWYRKAADQGHASAQYSLGLAYDTGEGVAKDEAEAVKWFRKAADQRHVSAQLKLGVMYATGRGVAKDDSQAVKWYRKAADQGVASAQFLLGLMYADGKGVAKDDSQAVKWYRKAADQGVARAQFFLGMMYADGEGVAKDDSEAVKWYRKAADQGLAEAQFNLGQNYRRGEGAAKDEAEAVKWFRKAADQGNAMAQAVLGLMYADGEGVVKDDTEAYKWMLLAGAQANEEARTYIPFLERRLTPDQRAEGQRLAGMFKPRQGLPTEEPVPRDSEDQSRPASSGTGFFITGDGFLVTNQHVVRDSTQIRLVTVAGVISAKVVKVDAANDLALLKAEGWFAALPVAASRAVKLGGTVATVGFPNIGLQGFAPKLAKGEIASLSGAQDDARYFQISVPVQPGNSGGALVDERGNVVGVVSAKLSARAALSATGALPENVNYAVKSSYLLSFLESVPEVSAKLKEPETKERKFEDVVKSAEQAAVLVLVY
jgi:TPR repeat protein